MIRYVRQKLGLLLINIIRMRHGVVIFYGERERARILDTIARVRRERKLLLSDHEAYQLFMIVQKVAHVEGDIAEVGTYQGVSSKLIAEARGNSSEKHIYLFDTFEGLPALSDIDRSLFHEGQYVAGVEGVRQYLSSYKNISIYKGLFPDTAEPIKNKKFSLVHFDVDTYESTKNSIEFFYPRMTRGGVILSHDYINSPGVKKAIDEYMKGKPEAIFESSWRQCMIVKA
ncbi:MAG TPA: TylF/MycF/NovP-related O-methyltransferase [Candidatus Paceibacterota bacterium]